jgi:hypothetical protein
MVGWANYHVRIRFHDGPPPWLLRTPRVITVFSDRPESFLERLVASEYATLKFLEKMTDLYCTYQNYQSEAYVTPPNALRYRRWTPVPGNPHFQPPRSRIFHSTSNQVAN